MAGPGLRRFWRIFRHSYGEERARRMAREKDQAWTTARAGFWTAWALAVTLNLIRTVADADGELWRALSYVFAAAWTFFAIWYLSEVIARRRGRRHG